MKESDSDDCIIDSDGNIILCEKYCTNYHRSCPPDPPHIPLGWHVKIFITPAFIFKISFESDTVSEDIPKNYVSFEDSDLYQLCARTIESERNPIGREVEYIFVLAGIDFRSFKHNQYGELRASVTYRIQKPRQYGVDIEEEIRKRFGIIAEEKSEETAAERFERIVEDSSQEKAQVQAVENSPQRKERVIRLFLPPLAPTITYWEVELWKNKGGYTIIAYNEYRDQYPDYMALGEVHQEVSVEKLYEKYISSCQSSSYQIGEDIKWLFRSAKLWPKKWGNQWSETTNSQKRILINKSEDGIHIQT